MIPEPYYSIYEIILLLGGEVESVNRIGEQYSVRLVRTVLVRDVAVRVAKQVLIPPKKLQEK